MSEIRDKVARAIASSMGEQTPFGEIGPFAQAVARRDADAAIAAFLEAIQEQGWQIVPVEPRNPMCDEAWAVIAGYDESEYSDLRMIYRAMLAAAPEWKP